ncbi:MAG: HlyD family efflux transporter periplasmic adaptor subunit [Candidatus Faecousia sp.]|nr:HlyD family efflux transporter periplasmic adaptor subunit [Candidatus Faecousia sp.]
MRKFFSVILVLCLSCGLFCGCGADSDVTVSVQSVSMLTGVSSIGMYSRYAGIVQSGDVEKIEKSSDLEILEVKVSAGDTVKAGQVLFTYDTDAISLDLEKKQLELEQLNGAIDTKTQQIAALEKEKASASSADQLDYTLQIQELQLDISESKYNVSAKEKEIARTKNLLENAEVKSPVDGTVQSVNETGATDNNGNPLPFMTVAQTGDLRVKGALNEQNRASLSEGMAVIIRSRTDESVTWTGTITAIDWENPVEDNSNGYYYMDYGSSDEMTTSTSWPFYVTLDSDDGLLLGQHVYIEPDFGTQEAQQMYLPAAFILDADSDPYVWVANDKDKLEKRSLTLGEYDADLDSYPVLDGLAPEDYIAFPDETCKTGVAVTRYDESYFGGDGMEGDEYGGEEEYYFDGEEGGDFAYGEDPGVYDSGYDAEGGEAATGGYGDESGEAGAETGAVG